MSIGLVELILIGICGFGVLLAVGTAAVYFIQRDREKEQ